MKRKLKIAFVCIHNSCRSQIAEALGKKFMSNKYDFYKMIEYLLFWDRLKEFSTMYVKYLKSRDDKATTLDTDGNEDEFSLKYVRLMSLQHLFNDFIEFSDDFESVGRNAWQEKNGIYSQI